MVQVSASENFPYLRKRTTKIYTGTLIYIHTSKFCNSVDYSLAIYRIAGKFDEQNIWRFAPPKVLGGFKFGDGQLTVA